MGDLEVARRRVMASHSIGGMFEGNTITPTREFALWNAGESVKLRALSAQDLIKLPRWKPTPLGIVQPSGEKYFTSRKWRRGRCLIIFANRFFIMFHSLLFPQQNYPTLAPECCRREIICDFGKVFRVVP